MSGLLLNRFTMHCATAHYVKLCIFPAKFCLFFCLLDRASSASTTQTMKIIEFSLFSVLVFKDLRNNKPDKLFWKPPQLFLGRKSWQKEPSRPAVAAVFQGPLRPKKQAWFFFLELSRVKKKEPKKKPLRKKAE